MEKAQFLISRPQGYVAYSFDEELIEATVIERQNRFVVEVQQNSDSRRCHLHDPGRLLELVYPGAKVLIRNKSGEKTDCSIAAGCNNGRWIVIDSRIHSEIAAKFLPENTKSEVRVGKKRLDFINGETYIEVKGSTLSIGGISVFPDAPTRRGLEHLRILRKLRKEGKRAIILILVLRDDTSCFVPNEKTDPQFSSEFYKAIAGGVEVGILKFRLEGNSLIFSGNLPLCQKESVKVFR